MLRKNNKYLGARKVSIADDNTSENEAISRKNKDYRISNAPTVFYKDKGMSYKRDDIKDYDYNGNFLDI
jgi:hypothetical protein